MAWDRNTPWRQGHVLPPEALHAFGLIPAATDAASVFAVVISHDCDLANDDMGSEPHAEVIVGRLIEAVSGNNTHAKVPRKLHLSFSSPEGPRAIELLATQKTLYPKDLLANFEPMPWSLTESEASVLQCWLGARYRRSAFPDEFNDVFTGAKLHERIAKILAPLGYAITAIFFDVQEANGLYNLGITLLYDTSEDPDAAEVMATKAAEAITEAFTNKLFNKDTGWQGIELAYCECISDEALTYRQSTMLKQWRYEYLSLRSDPQQPMIEE